MIAAEDVRTETVNLVPGDLPADYHCRCEFCAKYMGMLIREDGTKYSKNDRRKYYSAVERSKSRPGEKGGHIAKTPLHVARWAVQNYSSPGDWVLDPTIGAGTTAVEAINHGRNVVGVELEFVNVVKANVEKALGENPQQFAVIASGDARFLGRLLDEIKFNRPISLVVNNPPYSGDESQKGMKSRESFSYDKEKANLAFLREDEEYYETMRVIYAECAARLSSGGHLIIGVKDMVRNKAPYMLHEHLARVLTKTMEYVGMALLPHYPTTLFMNTWPKRFPDVKIPMYQTITVFRKP